MVVHFYFRDTPVEVADGQSVVFLTKALDGRYFARFYDTNGTLYEIPVTELVSVDPGTLTETK